MHFFRRLLGSSTYFEKDTVSSPNGVICCEHLYTELSTVWTLDDEQISVCIWYINPMCTHLLQCSLTDWQFKHIGRMVQSVSILIWSLWEREDLSSQGSVNLLEGYSMNDAFIPHIQRTCAEHVRHQAADVRNFSIL